VDLGALGSPNAIATASYLLGDRAFRRGRFGEALAHFQQAVASDSTFAMAAVRGAEAAGWAREDAKAQELIRVALDRRGALAPRYTHYLLGLSAFWEGLADSAIINFRQALHHDPAWAEAWAELGEAYSHLLPSEPGADSLQVDAFRRAYVLDEEFIPALYHLVEIALRQHDAPRAERFIATMVAAAADSTDLIALRLMVRCVKELPAGIDWAREAREHPADVLDVASALAVAGLHQPQCSEAAWNAILRHDTRALEGGLQRRYRALTGLHSLLVVERRYDEAEHLIETERRVPREQLWPLHVMAVAAGAPAERQAAIAADSLTELARRERRSPVALWALTVWEHHLGRSKEMKDLAARASSDLGQPGAAAVDTLVAQSLEGWAALGTGDTLAALGVFQRLRPVGVLNYWESLCAERMVMIDIHLHRADYDQAIRVASLFDSPGGVSYIIALRKSLSARVKAARGMHDEELARQMELRLAGLDPRSPQPR
jgi:tetratricopeptide (TPR) repeat protein